MSMTNFNLLDFLVLLLTFLCLLSDLTFGYYVNQWAVHVKGGLREADLLARKHNFINIGQVRWKTFQESVNLRYTQFQLKK